LLVYFEEFRDIGNAIARETQLKGWLREKKIALIRKENPLWHDLASDWY
jgi:putative endonuclease